MSQRLWIWLFVIVAAGALAIRLPQLDRRPLHTDESVHTLKFQELLEAGRYVYNPDEFHGPSLYYFTLPFVWLSSARTFAQTTEIHYRLVPVLFGLALILALPWLRDALGRSAVLWAALLTAISPAMVFYSRYYIHELILVFFTLAFLIAAWKYAQKPHSGWALIAGLSLGMVHATKETWVISFAAIAGAVALLWVWNRYLDTGPSFGRLNVRPQHVVLALGTAFCVGIVVFSSFFTNAAGPLDSIRTYLPWGTRAGGQTPHVHPWYFYLDHLTWFHRKGGPVFTEGLIVMLAVIGFSFSLLRQLPREVNPSFARFLGFYTLLLLSAYSIISYKTPWCLLGFYHGMILLAGIGSAALWHHCRTGMLRLALGVLIGFGCLHLLWQSYLANYVYAADPRNPWVYSHTQPNFLTLIQTVTQVAKVTPKGSACAIDVIVPGADYWPLPWYLRGFSDVHWWTNVPEQVTAPVVISSIKVENKLEPMIQGKFVPAGYYAQRPNAFLELYVELGPWKEYLKTLPPPRDD
jgi:uncharacterized protein (TIGR03663 family)